ncbi:MAG: RNA polymerase sigma factor [Candidatus Paceibacterota bacterium]|jgi:RNA polymerase sigma-70 factor (ECF subfamily)
MTKEKFSNIYDSHSKEIFNFLFLRTSSSDIAGDLTAETFFKFWKTNCDKPEDYLKNPRAFLYRLARNLLVDSYRKNSKQTIVSIDASFEDTDNENVVEIQVQSEENIEREYAESEKREMVLAHIKKLNPIYADVLIYHYIQGLDSKEIAIIIGRTEANTRVIIHRALESLKKAIK